MHFWKRMPVLISGLHRFFFFVSSNGRHFIFSCIFFFNDSWDFIRANYNEKIKCYQKPKINATLHRIQFEFKEFIDKYLTIEFVSNEINANQALKGGIGRPFTCFFSLCLHGISIPFICLQRRRRWREKKTTSSNSICGQHHQRKQ